MGNLFSRVFFSFWIAILVFAVAAVTLTALNFRSAENDSRAVARAAEAVLRDGGVDGLKAWVKQRNAETRGHRTLVFDERGRELLGQHFKFGPRPHMPMVTPDPPGLGVGIEEPRRGADDRRSREPRLDGLPPFGARIHGTDGGTFAVVVDPPPWRGPFSPFERAVILVLAVAISGLVSYLLARSISSPLEQLQRTARTLASGRLDTRTPVDVAARSDEVGALAREFDSMSERIASLIEARQQLLRDLSHELRSPLARLQMAVDLARQPGAVLETQMTRIEREGERLERLVAQILEYARLERDPSTLEREPVDLLALSQQVLQDAAYEDQAPAGRLQLFRADAQTGQPVEVSLDGAFDPALAVTVAANAQMLHSAIDNVVRNALRYGGEGAIEVTVVADAHECRVSVRDYGTGVPDDALARLFEPFYRVPRSPAAVGEPQGAGIGLAVAAKAVQLHGGRIVAENFPGGGLRMTLTVARDT